MIPVCSAKAIRDAENKAIQGGANEINLVLSAGKAIADETMREYPSANKFAVAAGLGNNGADVLCAAALIKDKGAEVAVFAVMGKLSAPNAFFRETAESKGIRIKDISSFDACGYDVVLDGIFGTGLNRVVSDEVKICIDKINSSEAKVVSADVPSGLNADSGEVFGLAVKADLCVAISAVKPGCILSVGLNYAKKIKVEEIGIDFVPLGFIVEEWDVVPPRRDRATHKGNYGRISVIGGSDNMPGAPLMAYESAVAATRSGAGLVRLCVGENEKCAYKARVTEQTLFYLPEKDGFITFSESKLSEIIHYSDSIVIGPGMGKNPELLRIISFLAHNFNGTIVIDADALNALSKDITAIKNGTAKIILTPHVGEFARLAIGVDAFDVKKVKEFALKNNVTLALKSAATIITDGKSVLFNTTGSACMAKGGSGDVLSGIVAAFSAVNEPLRATAKACYYFGKAGERAEKRLNSDISVIASDIIIENKDQLSDKDSK